MIVRKFYACYPDSVEGLMKTRINVWITTRSYEQLNQISIQDGRSLSDLLREAIRDYLDAHKGRLYGSGEDQQELDPELQHSS